MQLTIGNNRYTFNGDGKLINTDSRLNDKCGTCTVTIQGKYTCAVFGNNPTYMLDGETKPLFNSNED